MASDNLGDGQSRYISGLVRQADRDRYLAAILAPRAIRSHLLAFYAFDLEIQSIADRVTEPLAGEIRIQWWRDWLHTRGENGRSGNPVADALGIAIASCSLTVALVHDYLDAWSSVFQTDAPDQQAMEARLVDLELPVLTLAIEILGGTHGQIPDEFPDLTRQAGYIFLLQCIGSGRSCARYLVSDDLKAGTSDKIVAVLRVITSERQPRAATAFGRLPVALRPAFAHMAAYSGVNALKEWRAPNPLVAQWRIWRAMRTGRL